MDDKDIVARAFMLRAQAKACESEANDLLDSLGNLDIRNYPFGDYILKIEANKRFDGSTAKANLPTELFEAILVPTPNSTVAKRVLSGDNYAACQKDYGVKRSIVEVTDVE